MQAIIKSANSTFKVNALLTEQALNNSKLIIDISDAKKPKKGHILFSPNTSNTKSSIRLTRSWHVLDIEHCMNVLSEFNTSDPTILRDARLDELDVLNELEYMMTGHPGRFKQLYEKVSWRDSIFLGVYVSGSEVVGVICITTEDEYIYYMKTKETVETVNAEYDTGLTYVGTKK